jgi:hypothetical protein
MREPILVGQGRSMLTIPREKWEQGLSTVPHHFEDKLSFMSPEHHLIRYFVVRELPLRGEPLLPEYIAEQVNLPVTRVNTILDDLEQHLTFLFRNTQGMVVWAYPVTVDKTPHALTFSTGECVYAA